MRQFGPTLERWRQQWALGFFVLLALAGSAAVFGLAAGLIIVLVGGALGWSDGSKMNWFLASAAVWLPLSTGAVASFLRDATKPDRSSAQTDR